MDIPESTVREQVDRVVHSEVFRLSELQRRLLNYLAEKSLSGEADQLKEYTVAVDAFGKPESYDPRRDATVRLQTSKLRQKLLEYYQTAGKSDSILIDFPKGHFKLLFSIREATPPSAPAPAPKIAFSSLDWSDDPARRIMCFSRDQGESVGEAGRAVG
jgi:hypothetical protein